MRLVMLVREHTKPLLNERILAPVMSDSSFAITLVHDSQNGRS